MSYKDTLEVSEYKGNKILNVPIGINSVFAFGFTKAVILSSYKDEIKTFSASEGKDAGNAEIVISEYKGNKVIHIPTHSPKYPIKFGLGKARALINYMPEINEFIADQESEYLNTHGFSDENETLVNDLQRESGQEDEVPF